MDDDSRLLDGSKLLPDDEKSLESKEEGYFVVVMYPIIKAVCCKRRGSTAVSLPENIVTPAKAKSSMPTRMPIEDAAIIAEGFSLIKAMIT